MPDPRPGTTVAPFGILPGGTSVDGISITGTGSVWLRVLPYGGIIQSLHAPDAAGDLADVVLGFDALDDYTASSSYFGALIGRYANRIACGRFTLDGVTYRLDTNDGNNHLHGGRCGFDRAVWRAEPFVTDRTAGVVLEHESPDGDQHYPGRLSVRVTYTLDGDALVIDYRASADRATPVNLTNHTYFNLAGAGNGDVLAHELTIAADAYTPVSDSLIPTGEIALVAGTPFDFREATPIGERIDAGDEQLRRARGYDHNMVLRGTGQALRHAARLRDPASGRTLQVHTTEPGMQFYSGNFLDDATRGKDGKLYAHRGGVCLETQHFPNSPNEPHFPSTILQPGQLLESRTIYVFGTG